MPLKSFEKHLLTKEWLNVIKNFDCNGSKVNNFNKINVFLTEDCLKNNLDNYSRTNIYIKDGVCKAFYSLAMGSIELPRNKEEDYKPLKDYPALFLTHIAVDKSYHRNGVARAILNTIIKKAYENDEIAARFIFLDAYPESVSWYLKNPLFKIMYAPLSERIEKYCEKKIIEKLNERLKQGHTVDCELDQTENIDISLHRKNCETILTKHVNDIFKELAPEKSLLKRCDSKVKIIFDDNKPKIELQGFAIRNKTALIHDWLKEKGNILNIDVTIPLYADINKYYEAICDSYNDGELMQKRS